MSNRILVYAISVIGFIVGIFLSGVVNEYAIDRNDIDLGYHEDITLPLLFASIISYLISFLIGKTTKYEHKWLPWLLGTVTVLITIIVWLIFYPQRR